MLKKQRYFVIIPASGIGARFAAGKPKQYLTIVNKTIIEHTLDIFLHQPIVEQIIVTISPHDNYWHELAIAQHEKISCCIGGEHRADSVLAGLAKCAEIGVESDDWILVHDAVRPCLASDDLQKLITTVGDNPVGGLLVTPVRDTLKCYNNNQM